MDQTYGWKRSIMLAAIACLSAMCAASAQDLPAGGGRADFQRICSGCHSIDRATSQRMTRAEWAAVVSDMVARGAQGSSAELDNVVSYLSANFGKGNAAAPAGHPSWGSGPPEDGRSPAQ
jgi:hypothetical protein